MISEQTVAVVGLGTIGLPAALALEEGIAGLRLTAVCEPSRSPQQIEKLFPKSRPILIKAGKAADHADIVLDCANPTAFIEVAEAAISKGRTFITLNSAALLDRMDLIDVAKRSGGRVMVPSGALFGFDALHAAAQDEVQSVTIVTRKPPKSLTGAPLIAEKKINLDALSEPLLVFAGCARDAAKAFPQNVNVAASLSLAGIGPDRTRVEVWADPSCVRNTHQVTVQARAADFSFTIASAVNPANPRTGLFTPFGVIAHLRSLNAVLKVGS